MSSATYFVLVVFLALAPTLLLSRFIWRRPKWWLVVTTIVILGWAAWFITAVFYFDDLQKAVEGTENPDPDLVERATSDGAPLAFALVFGWLISLAYAVPWWLVYLAATWIRGVVRKS